MYKVGLIGLGKIAGMAWGDPDDPHPYNHAGGLRDAKKVQLAAVADLSGPAREGFREKWEKVFPDTRYYDQPAAMLKAEALDVVAVCVRGPYHFALMQEVIAAAPKVIFLEKPPTCSLQEMDEIVAAAKEKNVVITVSYSRHWSPHVLRLQELARQGLIGQVETVVGYTGHGILSFASHTTDLICQFAGYCPTAVYARGFIENEAPEGYEPEPTLHGMFIEFENGVRGVHIGRDGEHGGFYCDVFGSEGYLRAGIYTPPFARDKAGKPIDLASHDMPPNASVFTVAYDQIADTFDGGPLPHCTGEDWIAINEIGFAAVESVLTNQRILLPNQNRARKIFANG